MPNSDDDGPARGAGDRVGGGGDDDARVAVTVVKELGIRPTAIPGLLLVDLPVHGDNRGWFKENWQRAKLVALGMPDFGPVQNNISFNDAVGTTRGIHAEPWDKYVSVASGRIFGAWVDLREGQGFGSVVTAELDPSRAVFVPRGVGNAYQTLEPDTAYTYLVNDHWSPAARYTLLNLADPTAGIAWPIPLDRAEISAKDREHPTLDRVTPIAPRRTLVIGRGGQLGRALRAVLPGADFVGRDDLDLDDPRSLDAWPWRDYQTVINAAAFTAVDAAQTVEGRRRAWRVNATAVAELARIATENRLVLAHVSSDYVFDGSRREHTEDEPPSPLGVYGQSKAAGDLAAASTPRHYIVRTSWVIGDGHNFVRTMAGLAARGARPKVVADQHGRLTFTSDLALGIAHLITRGCPYGVYNLTNSGPSTTWYDIARSVFSLLGHDPDRVRPISTEQYLAGKTGVAPRPEHSTLTLERINYRAGFRPRPADVALAEYVKQLSADGSPN